MKIKNGAKQDLLIIDAETGLLSHPSTLECVSPNSGILFPNLFGASSDRITLYFSILRKSVQKFHISLTSNKTSGHLTLIPIYVFNNISLNSSKDREVFQTNVVEKITKHILCSIFFFFENRAVYEIMRKNIAKPDTSQMT